MTSLDNLGPGRCCWCGEIESLVGDLYRVWEVAIEVED